MFINKTQTNNKIKQNSRVILFKNCVLILSTLDPFQKTEITLD